MAPRQSVLPNNEAQLVAGPFSILAELIDCFADVNAPIRMLGDCGKIV